MMNRGRRREDIFLKKGDFELFMDNLEYAAALFNVRVAAWCLMTNHYHLMVHTPEGNLSRFMRHVDGVYTQRFNKANRLDGQLFRGRYKSLLIDPNSDRHMLAWRRIFTSILRKPVLKKRFVCKSTWRIQ